MKKHNYLIFFLIFLALSMFLSSCAGDFEDNVNNLWIKVSSVFGTKAVEKSKNDDVALSNIEFLSELYEVVGLEVANHKGDDFQKRLNVLNQGGSFEGVYNGMILDTSYVEKNNKVAHPNAIAYFAEEMQILNDDYLKITESKEFTKKEELKKSFLDFATDKNIYILKKVLGEQLIKNMYALGYKEKLASWYANHNTRLLKYGVDFGKKWRNSPDEYAHYTFAMRASEDRIHWEMLNKIHRIINSKNKF